MTINTVKKIVGAKQRPTVRIGTVQGRAGVRYRVEDDLGRTWFCWAEQPWATGARVTMTDNRITGAGPEKSPISIFEV